MSIAINGLPNVLYIAKEEGVITVDLTKKVTYRDDGDEEDKTRFIGVSDNGGIDFWSIYNIVSVGDDGNLFTDLTKAKTRAAALKAEEERNEKLREEHRARREAERAKQGASVDGGSF